jgi:hypothetical protein
VIRQLRKVAARRPTPPDDGGIEVALPVEGRQHDLVEWRRVLGTFQVSIPVQTRPMLLEAEERLLSVLRWIARSIPTRERWHPVFERYLAQVTDRVTALGGDPAQITPSSSGEDWRRLPPTPGRDTVCATGKIAGLIFDRYGDFEGFILDTEHGDRRYTTRERDLAELAERAWRERLRVTVCTQRHSPHQPETIMILQPPVTFGL